MNLVKINNSIFRYIDKIKCFTPNTFLYKKLGIEIMGRNFYFKNELSKDGIYFNKSIIHKEKPSYIGKNKTGYYAQDAVIFTEEERCLCVKGNCDKYQDFGDRIMRKIEFRDFVFDVGFIGKKMFLVEINELHLSSIDSNQLKYILSMIL